MSVENLSFEFVQAHEVERALEIELASFPPDEAASLDSLTYRQQHAPSLFLGVFTSSPRTLIAFTCATLTPSSTLSHASMSTHVPSAPFVAIHSVCVDALYRRKGVALALLTEYLVRLRQQPNLKGARLITHHNLIPLYTQAGFKLVGESQVVHGAEKWFEMKVDFGEETKVEEKAVAVVEVPREDGVRSPGKAWDSFGGIEELVGEDGKVNKADLYCPRQECRCLLLSAGAGTWVRGHSSDFVLPALPHPLATPSPSPSSSGYWSIPSPLSFENIGFSRNTLPPSAPSPDASADPAATIKYLICADCDHGPLGWHDTEGRDLGLEVEAENEGKEGELRKGREFLLDVERVRYRVKA
ncbi:hypothetical protein RQP46_006909 [Phenoliferia psychrophenolica]